jgi:tryptophan-rich sensory protein
MNSLVSLVVAVLIPQAVGAAAGAATSRSIRDWYPKLEKPWYTPPNWLFGPAWFVLYLMMGYASWRVWQVGWGEPGVALALTVYGVHLILNALWSILFFGVRRPDWALAEVVLLWTGVVASTALFWRVDTVAGALLLPYVAWVTFAAILNRGIVVRNPSPA